MTELRNARLSLFKTWPILVIGGCLAAGPMQAAGQTTLPNPPSTEGVSSNTTLNATPKTERAALPASSSAWRQLTPMQRQALAPLGAQWGALTAQQQAKWLTISKNFTQLPVADQITMHSRMADWVDLSPQQRNLARLNFNQMQSLPKEDKKAKWEAYQALPEEQKRLLGERTPSPAKSAAPTIKPLEAHRQVQTPVKASDGSAAPAATIDRKTLLPRPPSMAAPTQSQPLPSSADVPEGIKPSAETAPS
jgi:hypothetical protein